MPISIARIVTDDLSGPEVRALLAAHLEDMRAASPPESIHALDLDGLRHPSVPCGPCVTAANCPASARSRSSTRPTVGSSPGEPPGLPCRPFADYTDDPNSVYLTLHLLAVPGPSDLTGTKSGPLDASDA